MVLLSWVEFIEIEDRLLLFVCSHDQTSFLQIFLNILEYIWWSLHSRFLLMDMSGLVRANFKVKSYVW